MNEMMNFFIISIGRYPEGGFTNFESELSVIYFTQLTSSQDCTGDKRLVVIVSYKNKSIFHCKNQIPKLLKNTQVIVKTHSPYKGILYKS